MMLLHVWEKVEETGIKIFTEARSGGTTARRIVGFDVGVGLPYRLE